MLTAENSTIATRTVYREFFEGMRPEGMPFSEDELAYKAEIWARDWFLRRPQDLALAEQIVRAANFGQIADALNAYL